ncbi:MAG: phage holin family protein [Thermaerobacterales bacterium]
MRFLITVLVNGLALFIAAYLISGVQFTDHVALLVAAAVLGLANALVKPILMMLALPLTIITLGLFTFVVDALLILLVGALVSGFTVTGFFAALLAALLVAVVNALVPTR